MENHRDPRMRGLNKRKADEMADPETTNPSTPTMETEATPQIEAARGPSYQAELANNLEAIPAAEAEATPEAIPHVEPVNNGNRQDMDVTLALVVYHKLTRLSLLEGRIPVMENEINRLRQENGNLRRENTNLGRVNERLEEARLGANHLAAERTKELNFEREDHAKDMANFEQQTEALSKRYEKERILEMQLERLKKTIELQNQKPVGRIVLEIWMYSLETKSFEMRRAWETTTDEITTWKDLPDACRRKYPIRGVGTSYSWKSMVEDALRLDRFDSSILNNSALGWIVSSSPQSTDDDAVACFIPMITKEMSRKPPGSCRNDWTSHEVDLGVQWFLNPH
ncbi:hypothetical protein LTR84_010789 [Exophiala bonariae]|uniref:Uncharacterized protein n=1 Tax=Exophiala bonariae TaxID=1690606 RepID=A0AAV9NL25_9EURO|nr:hypothetical protein LTR84_010789 [Exophiala bonariae]